MLQPFSEKQLEFITNSTAKWNLAHGSVSSGKTVCTLFRFMQAIDECPDSDIAMIGHTSTTIYQNAIRLIMESPQLSLFRPFCTWFPSKHELRYKNKIISTIGAKDEGSIGVIQGRTLSLEYCDEMTLYPESIDDMLDTRLRKPHSMGFAAMNPHHPNHKLKQWIDKAEAGDKNYYALHFTMEDNPFLPADYVERTRNSLSGIFYKRNYLGMWCLAQGAIFDFFDKDIHVVHRPPCAAEYFIAAIDYGVVNAFACLLLGVNTGRSTQTGKKMWVEKEYFWDPSKKGRQKTNDEFGRDLLEFFGDCPIKSIYIDPSAEAMQVELQRKGLHVVHAKNDVENGIQMMTREMAAGNLIVLDSCTNLIREIQSYVWDSKAADKGYDEPLKKDDHAVDALRYAVASHKVAKWDNEGYSAKTLGFR